MSYISMSVQLKNCPEEFVWNSMYGHTLNRSVNSSSFFVDSWALFIAYLTEFNLS